MPLECFLVLQKLLYVIVLAVFAMINAVIMRIAVILGSRGTDRPGFLRLEL